MAPRLDTMLDTVQVIDEVVFLVGARPLWIDAEPCCVDLLVQAIVQSPEEDGVVRFQIWGLHSRYKG